MLECERINAFYGQAQILHDVSLKLTEGERIALAGKAAFEFAKAFFLKMRERT